MDFREKSNQSLFRSDNGNWLSSMSRKQMLHLRLYNKHEGEVYCGCERQLDAIRKSQIIESWMTVSIGKPKSKLLLG